MPLLNSKQAEVGPVEKLLSLSLCWKAAEQSCWSTSSGSDQGWSKQHQHAERPWNKFYQVRAGDFM